eukprot:3344288-Prorocentrum_lima.AAC.1
MTSSLVGSEMCIRDRDVCGQGMRVGSAQPPFEAKGMEPSVKGKVFVTVSYTHLTLPTICSV